MIGRVETFEPKRHFTWYAWPDLANLPKRKSLVKKLLDRTAMSVIYGPSNCGKTFVALDLAGHIALGWEWCGRKVRQGRVAYIAAEGGLGLEERLTAFRFHHDVEGSTELLVLPTSVDLCRPDASTGPLIEDLRQLGPIELVIVDTLSRAMHGGNENSPDDMGAFVGNCDRIRQETGAHVCIIHHSGKDEARGARGHSALRAATDTEIEVAKDDVTKLVSATVQKQRDHAGGDVFTFRLEPVEIGMDEDEEPKTSCTLVPAEGNVVGGAKPKVRGQAKVALDLLNRALIDAGEVPPSNNHIPSGTSVVPLSLWRRYCYEGVMTERDTDEARRKAFYRASKNLQDIGMIGVWGEHVWIAKRAGHDGT